MTEAEFNRILTCADPKPECWCETCRPITMQDMRMILCPSCGNKRCPHATDHRNACTGSNEPGQKGSSYEGCAKPAALAETGTKTILAIDPGTEESGWCVLADGKVTLSGVMPNRELLRMLTMQRRNDPRNHVLAIEMIASYGMAVGREVFETVWWIGRLTQAWHNPESVMRIYRQEVKLHLCKSPRAKDANVRQALIDLLGAPGTKRNPGATYGVKSHAWAALAVAVTASAKLRGEIE